VRLRLLLPELRALDFGEENGGQRACGHVGAGLGDQLVQPAVQGGEVRPRKTAVLTGDLIEAAAEEDGGDGNPEESPKTDSRLTHLSPPVHRVFPGNDHEVERSRAARTIPRVPQKREEGNPVG
jgi:hypothetical protein